MKIYDEVLDLLSEHFSKDSFENEVIEARKEFSSFFRISKKDQSSEEKLFSFIEWYLFYWTLGHSQKTPIELLKSDESILDLNEVQKTVLKNYFLSRHSLFSFKSENKESLFFKDLFSSYQFEILKSNFHLVLKKNQIIEARLIPDEKAYLFSRSLCLHPYPASEFILKYLKSFFKNNLSKKKVDVLFFFRKMRYQLDQYPHLLVEHVYSEDSKLKGSL